MKPIQPYDTDAPSNALASFKIQRVEANALLSFTLGEPPVNQSEKIGGLIPLEQVHCMPPADAGYP